MPARPVLQVTDSLDGKPLPEDTEPLTISVGRKSWKLYLSDASRQKVMKQIDDWTKDEEEETAEAFKTTRKTGPAKSHSDPAQLAAIREWAAANGHEVSPRGRIAKDVQEAYQAAH